MSIAEVLTFELEFMITVRVYDVVEKIVEIQILAVYF